jgi:uncharacterized membrane protein
MKKSYPIIIVALTVVFITVVWLLSKGSAISQMEIIQPGIIGLLLIFALFIGYSWFNSKRRGEPAEDELSKKIMMKASSLAFYISIYFWLVLMYYSYREPDEPGHLIGMGIFGMAVIFAVCWLVIRWRGIKNG